MNKVMNKGDSETKIFFYSTAVKYKLIYYIQNNYQGIPQLWFSVN